MQVHGKLLRTKTRACALERCQVREDGRRERTAEVEEGIVDEGNWLEGIALRFRCFPVG